MYLTKRVTAVNKIVLLFSVLSFPCYNVCAQDTNRSLSFIGSEEGTYIYKSGRADSWHSSDDYTIYMKLLLKYDD